MKNQAIRWVWFTTLYVFAFAVLTRVMQSFMILIPMLIFGQILILYMVYKVLTDNFKTTQDFDVWYQDNPKE